MLLTEIIRRKLEDKFNSNEIEIEDYSHLHKGHQGSPEGRETHFAIKIRSRFFEGKNRLERERMVINILGAELISKMHAINITAKTDREISKLKKS